jgi:tight adherence protein C
MLPTFAWAVIAGLLAFFAIVFAVAGAVTPPKRSPLDARLQQFAQRPRTLEEIELQAPFGERFLRPMVSGLARGIARLTPSGAVEGIQKRLIHAGFAGRMQAADFLGMKGFGALAGAAFGALVSLRLLAGFGAVGVFFALLLLGVLGYFVPDLWLSGRGTARRDSIQHALPDAIDLLTISVEAGLGFDAALSRVVEKSDNLLTRELGRVIAEMRVGVARRDALRSLVERTGVDDLAVFVTAIIQAEQLGASIANVLRIQASEMRVRRRQRAEVLAHQAPIKMLFPMVFLIFPPILVVVLGPAIPNILHVFAPGIHL